MRATTSRSLRRLVRSLVAWRWRPAQSAVVAVRVGAVVVGALVVKWSAASGRPAALVTAITVAFALIVIWNRVVPARKTATGTLLYLAAIAVGLALSRRDDVTTDLGLPAATALYVAVGLLLAGVAGIAKRLREARTAATLGGPPLVVLAAGLWWWGLARYRDDGTLGAVGAAGLVTYLALTLVSGAVLTRRAPDDEPTRPVPSRRHAWPPVAWLRERAERWWAWWEHRTGATAGDDGYPAADLWRRFRVVAVLALAASALVVVAVAVWAVRRLELDADLVVIGLVLLTLAVTVIAANNVADTVAALAIVSLAWALTPGTVALDGPEATTLVRPVRPGDTTLVVLGDSYISGEGAKQFYEGTNVRGANECRRAPSAYGPLLVGPDFVDRTGMDSLIFLACSGAATADLDDRPQHPGEPLGAPARLRDDGRWRTGATQLEQLDDRLRLALPARGLVLLSIGGNDAGFGTIAGSCVSLGNCAEVVDAWVTDVSAPDGIDVGLRRSFAHLRAVIGPDVPVLIVPYPIPLAADRCGASALSSREHEALRRFVGVLNEAVATAARPAGFDVLDLQEAFDGHRICDRLGADGPFVPAEGWYLNYIGANPVSGALREIANPRNWFHNSFHPNAAGHRAIAQRITSWIETNRDRIAGSSFALSPNPFRARGTVADIDARPSTRLGAIGSPPCVAAGPGWESAWSACRTGRTLLGVLVPALVLLAATWTLAIGGIVAARAAVHDRARRTRRALMITVD
jgi:hypothetical protein